MDTLAQNDPIAKKRRALRFNIKKIQSYEKCNYKNVRQLCVQVTKHQSPKNLYREVERLLEKQASAMCEIIVEGLRENNLKEWQKYSSSLEKVSVVMSPLEKSYVKRNSLKTVKEIGLRSLSDQIASDGYMRFHLRNFVKDLPDYIKVPSNNLFPLYEIAMTMIESIKRSVPWENMFSTINVIGHGNFGTVLKAEDSQNLTSAVKVIQHKSLKQLLESKELDVSLTMSHQSIVTCTDVWIEERTDLPDYLMITPGSSKESSSDSIESNSGNATSFLEVIVMEFFKSNLKQLLDYLAENKTFFTTTSKIKIFTDILCGLRYLHSKGIIHRDIKPENILIKKNTCKICDFGLVAFHKKNNALDSMQEHTPGAGTPMYTAPEVKEGSKYGPEADIYSLGVILLELTTPFATFMEMDKAIALQKCLDTEDVNYVWKYLASLLMAKNPQDRPTNVTSTNKGILGGFRSSFTIFVSFSTKSPQIIFIN